MPLVVHNLNNSRAQRVLWLLEELGVPYEVKHHQRNRSLQAPPELKAIHPLGKSPVVEDQGRVLAETGAIVEYILDTYANGRLRPPAPTLGEQTDNILTEAEDGPEETRLRAEGVG